MMKPLQFGVYALLIPAALATPQTGAAHHSFAMFDATREVTVDGVVKEFRWNNPHVFIQLLATGDGGTTDEWSIEMTSPEHLARAGWKPGALKSGDKVKIVIHPTRVGSNAGQYVSGVTRDGTPIGAPHQATP